MIMLYDHTSAAGCDRWRIRHCQLVQARDERTTRGTTKGQGYRNFRAMDSLAKVDGPRSSRLPVKTYRGTTAPHDHTTMASSTVFVARVSARQSSGRQSFTFAIGRVRHPSNPGVELLTAPLALHLHIFKTSLRLPVELSHNPLSLTLSPPT
jgi:hypothetical protein